MQIVKAAAEEYRSKGGRADKLFCIQMFSSQHHGLPCFKIKPCMHQRSPHPIYIEVLQTITIFKPCDAQNLWQKNLFKALAMHKIEIAMSIYNLLQLMQIWLNLPLDFNVLMVSAFNSNYFCQKKVKFSAIPTKNHRVKQTKFILPNPVSSGK